MLVVVVRFGLPWINCFVRLFLVFALTSKNAGNAGNNSRVLGLGLYFLMHRLHGCCLRTWCFVHNSSLPFGCISWFYGRSDDIAEVTSVRIYFHDVGRQLESSRRDHKIDQTVILGFCSSAVSVDWFDGCLRNQGSCHGAVSILLLTTRDILTCIRGVVIRFLHSPFWLDPANYFTCVSAVSSYAITPTDKVVRGAVTEVSNIPIMGLGQSVLWVSNSGRSLGEALNIAMPSALYPVCVCGLSLIRRAQNLFRASLNPIVPFLDIIVA
mmetsp:Transcript_66065/g.99591  ORF Transcript_66065/g.99591 Transcript_66065/m.99591 type:complete len:268 (+) Transcript_66065:1108-1911(+)